MIEEAVRLKLEAGLSHEQTARALRISKGGSKVRWTGRTSASGATGDFVATCTS